MGQTFVIWIDYRLKNNAASKMISSHCVWDCFHDLFFSRLLKFILSNRDPMIYNRKLFIDKFAWWIDVFFWSLFSQLHKSRWLSDLVCFWPLWKWSGLKWRRCQGLASVQVINYVSQLFWYFFFQTLWNLIIMGI